MILNRRFHTECVYVTCFTHVINVLIIILHTYHQLQAYKFFFLFSISNWYGKRGGPELIEAKFVTCLYIPSSGLSQGRISLPLPDA